MTGALLLGHLWQSTLFAAAIATLVWAFRGHRARVRYWMWFTASVKFLIPFAALSTLGNAAAPEMAVTPPIVLTMAAMSQPLLDGPLSMPPVASEARGASTPAPATVALWAVGAITLACLRMRTWHRIRRLLRSGSPVALSPLDIPVTVMVRAVPGLMEPAVVGVWRQTLLVPLGLERHLTRAQLNAVVVHELCHVRHRDNLTAAIHMAVEAICWFHPVVWLIGTRLLDERERACDEEVLATTGTPRVYAEAILNVCKRYVAAPSPSVAGVASANLRARIESIMAGRVGRRVSTKARFALATAAALLLVLPVASATVRAIVQAVPSDLPAFDVASIKRNRSGEFVGSFGFEVGGRLAVVNNAVQNLVRAAYGVQTYQILGAPDWVTSERYDVSARAEGSPSRDQMALMLRRLLLERFKMVARQETREIPIYALVMARPGGTLGSGLRPAAVDCRAITAAAEQRGVAPELPAPRGNRPACGTRSMPGAMMGAGVSMSDLARNLAQPADRLVVDRTGLTGVWDLDLQYVPSGPVPNIPGVPPPRDDGVSLFTALQEQLGLKLEPQRAPADVLVIVSIERPTED